MIVYLPSWHRGYPVINKSYLTLNMLVCLVPYTYICKVFVMFRLRFFNLYPVHFSLEDSEIKTCHCVASHLPHITHLMLTFVVSTTLVSLNIFHWSYEAILCVMVKVCAQFFFYSEPWKNCSYHSYIQTEWET